MEGEEAARVLGIRPAAFRKRLSRARDAGVAFTGEVRPRESRPPLPQGGGRWPVNGIAEIVEDYPSKGVGEKGAWFKDSEGNLLGIGQPVR
jgi:hypothetical protein